MPVTTKEILMIGQDVRSDIKEPYGYCHVASKKLLRKLSEMGIPDSKMEIREVCMGWDGGRKIKHDVLLVRGSEVVDMEYQGSIIVDLTLDQYSKRNYEQGKVATYVGHKSEIDNVNIFRFSSHPYEKA